ncbi:MAG TPA: hypothetical protein VMV22_14830 [Acidimicrobiales bacterium]|nr:hypothetical protein [Acidimicrobiales bacterium]
MTSEHWKDEPEEHDYPAARAYLSLLVDPAQAKRLAKALERSPGIEHYMAKDILRASGLPLLPADDPEVAKDLGKVQAGTKLSPVLLVRGAPLWVADGYHRVCASYHLEEDTSIPCRIVSRGAASS